ncbi:VapC toxin protein [Thermococcus sp. 2319x1]|uniref:hypothetical protein n=1 Tax=Thermococcus sp. 2319x1 TaxID=1674923 RepID=UPI00073ADD6F|nr:VapC toxin protein [Thermococcus sp. 2319x1]
MVQLPDTSVVIELFKGNTKVSTQLPPEREYALPSIVLFELLCCWLKPRQRLVNFDRVSAEVAG